MKYESRQLFRELIFIFLVFFQIPVSVYAEDIIIRGKVVSTGSDIKIAYEGEFSPVKGDPVEIGFNIGDDFIPVEGQWKISKVEGQFAWAKALDSNHGDPSIGYLAVIKSSSLRKERKPSHERKMDSAKEEILSDLETVLKAYRQTPVTNNFSVVDTYDKRKSGEVQLLSDKIIMKLPKKHDCTVSIGDKILEDFQASFKVTVEKGDQHSFLAGFVYGDRIDGHFTQDSIIFKITNFVSKGSKSKFYNITDLLARKLSDLEKKNNTIPLIKNKYIEGPDNQNPTPGRFTVIKTGSVFRLFWNDKPMGLGEETGLKQGRLWIIFTKPSNKKIKVVFEDIKVTLLHK